MCKLQINVSILLGQLGFGCMASSTSALSKEILSSISTGNTHKKWSDNQLILPQTHNFNGQKLFLDYF